MSQKQTSCIISSTKLKTDQWVSVINPKVRPSDIKFLQVALMHLAIQFRTAVNFLRQIMEYHSLPSKTKPSPRKNQAGTKILTRVNITSQDAFFIINFVTDSVENSQQCMRARDNEHRKKTQKPNLRKKNQIMLRNGKEINLI